MKDQCRIITNEMLDELHAIEKHLMIGGSTYLEKLSHVIERLDPSSDYNQYFEDEKKEVKKRVDIVVSVSGGVAEVWTLDESLSTEIIDFDDAIAEGIEEEEQERYEELTK